MIAVRAATSGSALNLPAQTGPSTAMTAFSELVLAVRAAETVREQEHTYNHSTRSGPQRRFYDFPIDSHWAFLLLGGK
jgi:hypothetical protein